MTTAAMRHLVPESELSFSAIRAQGPGGQNVNKVSCAVHLRFDIAASSLPDAVKQRLLASADHRISGDGVLVIKAQGSRSLESNKAEALERLHEAIERAAQVAKPRRATKPSYGSKQRRLQGKAIRSTVKLGRGKVQD
jgi:ribosome-associated protein